MYVDFCGNTETDGSGEISVSDTLSVAMILSLLLSLSVKMALSDKLMGLSFININHSSPPYAISNSILY